MIPTSSASPGATFVLVHGAFHGGWCWSRVAHLLRARGHTVLTPTQTGLGERAHLLRPDTSIETFVEDVAGVLDCEEPNDVILVAHSLGGIAVSGTADRVPERIAQIVYLDATLVLDGDSALSGLSPKVVAAQEAAVVTHNEVACLPVPAAEMFNVTASADVRWLNRRLTPHPARSYRDTVHLAHPLGNGLPCTYITCTQPLSRRLASSRELAQAQPGWQLREIETGHDAMITHPHVVAEQLMDIALHTEP